MPKFSRANEQTTGTQSAVIRFYDNDILTLLYVTDLYINLVEWTRKHPQGELYIYVKSDTGRIRSVYVANKCGSFLASIGYEVDILHMELSRKKLQ